MKVITSLKEKLAEVMALLLEILPLLMKEPTNNNNDNNSDQDEGVLDRKIHQLAEQIQSKMVQLEKVYLKNVLFVQFSKKVFSFGFSTLERKGFCLPLLKLRKKPFKAFMDDFASCASDVLGKLFEEVYFSLPLDVYHPQLNSIINYITDEKTNRNIRYDKVEFFKDEYYDEMEIDLKMLQNRKKLESGTILFDNTEKKLWWNRESIEEFVHHFKIIKPSNEADRIMLEKIFNLIFSIRKLQIQHIIEVNKVDYQFFESIGGVNSAMKQKLVAVMKKDKENNKLRNLFSKGFNSNAFHFILEFIQNTDDAEFDEMVEPSLHFKFSNNSLTITSNEKGFTYDNLYSLSGIASSDKIEKKLEKKSIGEKGLGFKTIFSVCDSVKLYSNGFCANLTPEHLEEISPGVLDEGTRFELQTKTFNSKTFDKYILLTLKKLNCISFQEGNFREVYRKRREGNDIILESDIGGTKQYEKFLCVEKTIDMSDIIEEKRINYSDATLQLYLPYSGLKVYNLHAYLPVNNIGLSFIIQSDFVLSQNRESVIVNEWNNRIISQIPDLFCESFENVLKHHHYFKRTYLSLLQKQPSESFPTFSNVINNIQKKLLDIECIPIFSDENIVKISPDMFEFNPFEIFGPSTSFSILKKYCLHPSITLSDDFMKMPQFDQKHLIALLSGVGEEMIFKKIESVCVLMKHFNVDVRKYPTLKLIPTELDEMVTPNEKVYYSQLRLPKPLILTLKENGYYVLSRKIQDGSTFHPLHPPFPHISDEVEFIFTILRSGKNASNQHVPFKIFTTNGEWKLSNSVFEYNDDCKLLSNVSFCDIKGMLKILLKYGLKINQDILIDVLEKCGVRKLPIISKELIEKFEDWKTFLLFVNNNWDEYRKMNEQQSIVFHINNSVIGNKRISDLYAPNLKKFLKDHVEYIPSLRMGLTKFLNYTKEMDVNSYSACILDAKQNSNDDRILELLKIMEESLPYLHLQTLVAQNPVLKTSANEYTVLDEEVLFKFVPKVLFEKYIFHELHPKLHPFAKKLNIPTIPERIIVDELISSTSTSYEYYENLLHYLIKYGDMSKYSHSNIIYYEGKKVSLRDTCWKLDKISTKVLPSTVIILSKHYKDGELASYFSQHTSEANIESEIYRYYTSLIDKISQSGDGSISKVDREFLIHIFDMIEKKVFQYFPLIKVDLVWDLEILSDIPTFNHLCMISKFKNNKELAYKAEKHFRDNNLLLEKLPSDLLIKFLTLNNSTEHFIQVCEYIEENGYKFGPISAPIIICGEQKFKPSEVVIQRLDSTLNMYSRSILNFYEKNRRVVAACRILGVCESLSVETIQNMIIDLQSNKGMDVHSKCHMLYTILNNYLDNGMVTTEEINKLKKLPIFRDISGNHHVYNSKICLNDDEVLYQEFKSDLIILCIPFVSSNSISKFCEIMNINGIEKNIKYQIEQNFEIVNSGDHFKLIEERIKSLLLYTNYYCKFRGYPYIKEETVKVCGARNLSILANFRSDNIEITKRVKSSVFIDKHKIIVDVEAELDDIVNNKFFNTSFLQFYSTNETNKYELSNLIDVLAPKTSEQMLSYFKRKGYRMDLKM